VSEHARALEKLAKLAEIASERAPDTLKRALAAAKEELGMDVAFVSEFTEERMVFRELVGDGESFGWRVSDSLPLHNTYCRLLMAGHLPNLIPDARNDVRVKDLEVTGAAGIGSYVGVPVTFPDGRFYGTLCALSHSPNPSLRERDAQFVRVLARLVAESLEREQKEMRTRRLAVESAGLRALLAALEARDGYSGDHSRSVVGLAVETAQKMSLRQEEVAVVEQCALLHDVGKIAVPDPILKKAGHLDAIEREAMREHAAVGARIVGSLEGLAHLAPTIRATHERWDGTGYPDGLEGERIPLASRIVHGCDAWHAMRSDRPYRQALSTAEAIEEMRENVGRQFDPRVVEALAEVLKDRRLLSAEEVGRIRCAYTP
ncbi:MAG: HD domain-containing protein, partial [Actinomycetota bacterium]|nr:HD domain-containing protein [Actinomycetota bacterium]